MIKKIFLLTYLLLVSFYSQAATLLNAGDAAFVGINSDGNDDFAFVLLVDVENGTQILITDRGWNNASGFTFNSGDGDLTWVATSDLNAGTVVHIETTKNGIFDANSLKVSTGAITGSGYTISSIGDQLFLYQGTFASPNFITGIHYNVEAGTTDSNWDGSSTSNSTSALPVQLTNGVNAIWVYDTGTLERDNFMYDGPTSGNAATLSREINSIANWLVDASGATPYDLSTLNTSAFSVQRTTAPTITTSSATSVTSYSATLWGNASDDGGAAISSKGLVYSESSVNSNPEIGGVGVLNVSKGTGTGAFNEVIGSFIPGTQYSFKAYATNSSGTSYGDVQIFSTLKLDQSIIFNELSNVTYGSGDFEPGAGASSALSVSYTSSNENVATIYNGLIHIVGAGTCTIYADQAGNEMYNEAVQVSQTLTVEKANQTISFTAIPNLTYGDADYQIAAEGGASGNPILYTSSNENVATVSNANGAWMISVLGAGNCTIYVNQAGNDNYHAATQVSTSFTVNKASLTARVNDAVKKYGEPNPEFSITYVGFVNDDAANDLDNAPSITTTADQYSDVGDYPINLSIAEDNNYSIDPQNGTLTINKATLSVTADDNYKIYGEGNPAFTLSYSNFVGSDDEGVLDELPQINCDADENSPHGNYPITVSGAFDNNYDFEYKNGVLTVSVITDVKTEKATTLNVSPNPTNGMIQVCGVKKDLLYKLYSSNGILLLSGQLNGTTIDISELNQGVYLLNINNCIHRIIKK